MYDEVNQTAKSLTRGVAGRYASMLASLLYQVINEWEFMVVLEDDVAVPSNFAKVCSACHQPCCLGSPWTAEGASYRETQVRPAPRHEDQWGGCIVARVFSGSS